MEWTTGVELSAKETVAQGCKELVEEDRKPSASCRNGWVEVVGFRDKDAAVATSAAVAPAAAKAKATALVEKKGRELAGSEGVGGFRGTLLAG